VDKINFPGEEAIVQYIYNLLKDNSAHPKFAFQKTKEDSATKTPAFKVTLGIIPDYFYEGGGVRADGISKDKPAEKAGLQAGDVIIQLGEYKTGDINAYMRALSKFKKGDKTEVKIRRGKEELTLPLQF
jgi:S1-C subfamily serine protease